MRFGSKQAGRFREVYKERCYDFRAVRLHSDGLVLYWTDCPTDWSLVVVHMRQSGTVLVVRAVLQTGLVLAVHSRCLIFWLLIMSDRMASTDSTVRVTAF